jgi:intracellular septation protein A
MLKLMNATHSAASAGYRHVIELPSVPALLVRAFRVFAESTLIPLGLFWLLLRYTSVTWAVVAALSWSYTGVIRRLVSRERVPGMLMLGSMLVTARAIVTLMTHSTFMYFLQPTLGTFLVAGLFLLSVPLGRPLTEKLAHDFCPLPDRLLENVRFQQFLLRISLLWGLVFVTNGSATLWLLLTRSVGDFLLLKSLASGALTVGAIVASYLWFRWSLRHEGVVLRWGSQSQPQSPAPAAAIASAA